MRLAMRAIVLPGVLFALVTTGCAGDVGDSTGPQGTAINHYIQALPFLPVAPPNMTSGTASQPSRTGD